MTRVLVRYALADAIGRVACWVGGYHVVIDGECQRCGRLR